MNDVALLKKMAEKLPNIDKRIIMPVLELAKDGFVSTDALDPIQKVYFKEKLGEKKVITLSDIHRVINLVLGNTPTDNFLPPCIRSAVSVRDEEALDDIFSYFHTYGTEKLDATLWSFGYYNINDYNQKKHSALAMVKSSHHFPCTPLEKPPHLQKYCPGDCLLRSSSEFKLRLMVDSMELKYDMRRRIATLTVRLKDGSVFQRRNGIFTPPVVKPFFITAAQQFLEWYSRTHWGEKYSDVLLVSTLWLADFFMKNAEKTEVGSNATSTVYQEDAEQL